MLQVKLRGYHKRRMLKHNLFGVFLKEKRQEKNISLRELSYRANIWHTYIAKMENGSKPPPSDDVLLRLAKGLNLDDESSGIFFDLAAKSKNADVLKTLKSHIAMGLNANSINDNSIELQIRIAEIEKEFSKLITDTNTENANDDNRESLMETLLTEKIQLKKQLDEIEILKKNKQLTMSRLDEIYSIIDLLRNHPLTYDDQIVREILECVVVESKDKIRVVFKGGIEIIMQLPN